MHGLTKEGVGVKIILISIVGVMLMVTSACCPVFPSPGTPVPSPDTPVPPIQVTETVASVTVTPKSPPWKFTVEYLGRDGASLVIENVAQTPMAFSRLQYDWEVLAIINEKEYPYPVTVQYPERPNHPEWFWAPQVSLLPPGFRTRVLLTFESLPKAAQPQKLVISSQEQQLVFEFGKSYHPPSEDVRFPTSRTDFRALGEMWELPDEWDVTVLSTNPVMSFTQSTALQLKVTNKGGYDQDVLEGPHAIEVLVFVGEFVFQKTRAPAAGWKGAIAFSSAQIRDPSNPNSPLDTEICNPVEPTETCEFNLLLSMSRDPHELIDLSDAKISLYTEDPYGQVTNYVIYDAAR